MFAKFVKSRNSKKGFTLIEMMVVVAIIAILAAVAIPAYLSYREDAQIEVAKASLSSIVDSMNGFNAVKGRTIGVVNTNGDIQGTIQDAIDKLADEDMHAVVDRIDTSCSLADYCEYSKDAQCFTIKSNVSRELWLGLCIA